MRILIIGGTGNISRWFTAALAAQGHELVLYNRGNIKISFAGNVSCIKGDRTDHINFTKQMQHAGIFNCVIDMIGYEPDDAINAVKIFMGKTAQYIFCSTVDVYSKQQLSYPVLLNQPIHASPTFPYAYKKMQMEKILWEACEKNNFPLTVIRPAATYSEGRSPLVTSFGGQTYHLDRLLKGLPVILHGDGSAIWVATHSSDVANAFVNAVGKKQTIGKAYNVTGDELLTWRSMHTIVAEELNAPQPEFVCIPTAVLAKLAPAESEWSVENFQYNNIFDNQSAKTDLNFLQTISFREGTRRCITWLKENDGIESCDSHRYYYEILQHWKDLLLFL